jgi:hypothetical protein
MVRYFSEDIMFTIRRYENGIRFCFNLIYG